MNTIIGKLSLGSGVNSVGVKKGGFEESEMRGGKDLLDLFWISLYLFLPTRIACVWCVPN